MQNYLNKREKLIKCIVKIKRKDNKAIFSKKSSFISQDKKGDWEERKDFSHNESIIYN